MAKRLGEGSGNRLSGLTVMTGIERGEHVISLDFRALDTV
jgi:hypothetical protein